MMNLKNLFTDEDAVSPVIGVILMVAITVILAAVIGAFVLNIGGNQETAPQAQISADYNPNNNDGYTDGGAASSDDDEVILNVGGGKTFDANQLQVSIGDEGPWDPTDDTLAVVDSTSWGTSTAAGDSVTFIEGTTSSDPVFESGDTVEITWTSSSGDNSQIIFESQVP